MNVPYFKPWISSKDKKAIVDTLNQRWLTNGPKLQKFENQFSQYLKSKYSVGVGSATHALHLAVKSLGIGPGDEVLIPTFTFAATLNCVLYSGAKPVLVDVDPATFTINPQEIEKKISSKTRAIIVVHYGGQSCDMRKILKISRKYHLEIIEDCAHALGSTYGKSFCGTIGKIGCFSFYPTKIITTGEGGMVSTSNTKLFQKISLLKSHSMTINAADRELKAKWKYDITDLGYNYRLDEIRASLGISQLKRIKQINQLRIKIASKYNKLLKNIPGLTIPETVNDRNHIYHLYTIKIDNNFPLSRDELFTYMHKRGVGTSVQYLPLHFMTFYKKLLRPKLSDFPVSNKLKDQVLCLPIFPQMTVKQIHYVTSILKNISSVK